MGKLQLFAGIGVSIACVWPMEIATCMIVAVEGGKHSFASSTAEALVLISQRADLKQLCK